MKIRLSRYDYIRYSEKRDTFTVGVKGTVKTVFKGKDIEQQIKNIQTQSIKYSEAFSKNSKFPDFLGQDGQPTKLLNGIVDKLLDIQNKETFSYSSEKIREDLLDLKFTSEYESNFKEKFASEINQYYGTKFDTETTFKHLSAGHFKSPKADKNVAPNKYVVTDPTRYQDWFLSNVDDIDSDKLNSITSITELNDLSQAWELSGRTQTPTEIKLSEEE